MKKNLNEVQLNPQTITEHIKKHAPFLLEYFISEQISKSFYIYASNASSNENSPNF